MDTTCALLTSYYSLPIYVRVKMLFYCLHIFLLLIYYSLSFIFIVLSTVQCIFSISFLLYLEFVYTYTGLHIKGEQGENLSGAPTICEKEDDIDDSKDVHVFM